MRLTALIAALALLVVPALGQQRALEQRDLEQILQGLDAGIRALQQLGDHDEAVRLARIAGRVEAQLEHRRHAQNQSGDPTPPLATVRSEEDVQRERIEVLRLATTGFGESKQHRELCTQLEMAIDLIGWSLEGRPEMQIRPLREHAPNDRELARILGIAAKLLRAEELPADADRVEALAADLVQRDERRVDGPQRAVAHQQIELLLAAKALLGAAKRDKEANVVFRMIDAQRVRLDGHKSGRAQLVLAFEPAIRAQAEVVRFAGRLAAEAESTALAQRLADYGEQIAARAKAVSR